MFNSPDTVCGIQIKLLMRMEDINARNFYEIEAFFG